MPAKGPGFGGSGRPRITRGYGMAKEVPPGSGTWISRKSKGITTYQAAQNASAKTYKTIDAARSAAAKKAAATRKANAAAAAKAAAKSNRAKGRTQGRKQGLKAGLVTGASAGAAAGYASSYVGRGSEGPKKSKPVAYKKKTATPRNRKATEY